MNKYRVITSNIVYYNNITEADNEEEAIRIVNNGDSDVDFLDADDYQIVSIERLS